MHKKQTDCYEFNVYNAQKMIELLEILRYNWNQYTDIEELRRMSHESFRIKDSKPGTTGCGRTL